MLKTSPVVLITGAARRIGAAIAKKLHEQGFNIALHYNHSKKEAEDLAEKFNVIRNNSATILQADLNDLEHIKQLVSNATKQWGRLDALINNASSFFPTPLGECNQDHWDNLIGSNLKAPFFLSQACIPYLKSSKGHIINIADLHAQRPLLGHSIYCIAKAGNIMLTKTLAKELAPDIKVNGIAPGAIAWPEDKSGNDIIDPSRLDSIPMKSLGGVDSIAIMVRFLLQDASYVTGQIFNVDGGKSLNQ